MKTIFSLLVIAFAILEAPRVEAQDSKETAVVIIDDATAFLDVQEIQKTDFTLSLTLTGDIGTPYGELRVVETYVSTVSIDSDNSSNGHEGLATNIKLLTFRPNDKPAFVYRC